MLVLTLIGGIARKNKDSEKPSENENNVEPETVVVPDSFKGTISDSYDVPQEIMKVITDYMDAYYKSIFTFDFVRFLGREILRESKQQCSS